ncbi:PIR protein [Plasmodium vivax]|uniref:VIR protein n=1 Tax=Plasmodium vivax TaxID=5855 RepID=A0A565A5S6_PLAVI|nr:PIR protein [Plasmodium vivax]
MLEIFKEDFFDKLEKEYAFLWNLPLSYLYTSFNLRYGIETNYEGICNTLSIGSSNSDCDLRYFCKNVQRLLSELKEKYGKEYKRSFYKACEYLSYWIYDKIPKNCEKVDDFYTLLDKVKLGFIPAGESCNIQKFRISKENFLAMKTLFFHSEALYYIKNEYTGINKYEKDKYNKFLSEAYKVYKIIMCNSDFQAKENYNNELTKFKTNFNNVIDFLKVKEISISQNEIPLDDKLICHPESRPTSTGVLEAGSKISQLEKSVASRGTDMVDTVINGDTSLPDTPIKAGTVGATLAGTSLFLLMMYKYTPLGSWVSTKILRKDKLMENMKKNNYELLLNDLGNREMGLNDTMYHISYNSATKQ